MQLEKMIFEYDGFPVLAVFIEDGKRYFCNGTEFRSFERIVAYPATVSQLIQVLTNAATPAEVFGNAETVWVATLNFDSEKYKVEQKAAADLSDYDKLPEREYVTHHPGQFAEYVEFLKRIE